MEPSAGRAPPSGMLRAGACGRGSTGRRQADDAGCRALNAGLLPQVFSKRKCFRCFILHVVRGPASWPKCVVINFKDRAEDGKHPAR